MHLHDLLSNEAILSLSTEINIQDNGGLEHVKYQDMLRHLGLLSLE